jgi:hypothetical protein
VIFGDERFVLATTTTTSPHPADDRCARATARKVHAAGDDDAPGTRRRNLLQPPQRQIIAIEAQRCEQLSGGERSIAATERICC